MNLRIFGVGKDGLYIDGDTLELNKRIYIWSRLKI